MAEPVPEICPLCGMSLRDIGDQRIRHETADYRGLDVVLRPDPRRLHAPPPTFVHSTSEIQ